MDLFEFDELIGGGSYVRCGAASDYKARIDKNIIGIKEAYEHLKSGRPIGWWVKKGYYVVDFDENIDVAEKIINRYNINTLMCRTKKGLHIYFKGGDDVQRVKALLPVGIPCDTRVGEKGYVLLPFGLEGRDFIGKKEIIDIIPEFIAFNTQREPLIGLGDGDGRNESLLRHLMGCKNRGIEDLHTLATVINEEVFSEPMPESEITKILKNVENYEAKDYAINKFLFYSDKNVPIKINARAIVDHLIDQGGLVVLNGEIYKYEQGVFKEHGYAVRDEIKQLINSDLLITDSNIKAVYRLLIDDVRLQVKPNMLNSNSFLVNFKNGVYDLKNQELKAHSQDYLFTIQIPNNYIEASKDLEETLLYKFLKEQALLENDDIDLILDYMAYCMTMFYNLKCFLILYGQSNTGKTVLIRFFEKLIGETNISNLSIQQISERFYPAELYGKLMNSCGDNSSVALDNIENIKKITGGDLIMHEKKGQSPFFFRPFSKLLFSFNQLPLQLEEKSDAFYGRMRIVYMNNVLNLNQKYVDTLLSSVEEIIPHLLNRLPLKIITPSKKSLELVEMLRGDSDSVYSFLKACTIQDPKKEVAKDALYEAYYKFCSKRGREAHKKHQFSRYLRSQGVMSCRLKSDRRSGWKGITLKTS